MPKEKDDTTVIDKLNKEVPDEKLKDDDFFETLLNQKVEIPTDDDPDPKETKKDDTDPNDLKKEDNDESVEALKKKIATLEKEAKGRLTDTVKSRQEKAQFKTELAELKTAVSKLLETKQDLEKKEDKLPLEDPKRKIEFEEDESAFVDLSPVKTAIEKESEKTQKQIDELKQAEAIRIAKERYEKTINEIIDIDRDRYDPAYSKLQEIMKALNDKVIDAQNRTGVMDGPEGGIDIDAGLDLLDGSPEEKEFLKEYPNVNPINIARAFNSKKDLKFALEHISSSVLKTDDKTNSLDKDDEEILKKAKNKPGSLTGQENQAGATDGLIEKISSLPAEEIMKLSDAEAEKVMKLMLDDELRGE